MAGVSTTRWSTGDLADAIVAGLHARAQADDLEQAVYGFDRLDELGLHPLIQQSLRDAGYGVWPEQQYPDDWSKPRRSEGKRCDMVLTPGPDRPLRDPLIRATLFDNADAIDPGEAYWLEVKTVAQFETTGPFARYSAELYAPVTADIKKLWQDGVIQHAGLLLVLFTADARTAEHDLALWHRRCLDKGLPVSPPAIRGLTITDRIGNGYCSVAVFAVHEGQGCEAKGV